MASACGGSAREGQIDGGAEKQSTEFVIKVLTGKTSTTHSSLMYLRHVCSNVRSNVRFVKASFVRPGSLLCRPLPR